MDEEHQMAIKQELDTFRQALPGLLANPRNRGKFALVYRSEITVCDDLEAGLQAGYERYEVAPFLVQEIAENVNPAPRLP
jgi:hypothetical protein